MVFCVFYLGIFIWLNLKLFFFKLNRLNYLRKKFCLFLELFINFIYFRLFGVIDDKKVWFEIDIVFLMYVNIELV